MQAHLCTSGTERRTTGAAAGPSDACERGAALDAGSAVQQSAGLTTNKPGVRGVRCPCTDTCTYSVAMHSSRVPGRAGCVEAATQRPCRSQPSQSGPPATPPVSVQRKGGTALDNAAQG